MWVEEGEGSVKGEEDKGEVGAFTGRGATGLRTLGLTTVGTT